VHETPVNTVRLFNRPQGTGDAAIAKLVFDYPQFAITDYMLLLRIDGEWKIVDKIYQGQRRARK